MKYSLKSWHTFGVMRFAKEIIYAVSIQQLLSVWRNAIQKNQPVLILGEGSNILFLEDFSGTVIINRISGITISESNDAWHLHVGAGENWHQLVQFTIAKDMPGLENLALIPGCVGSSPIQNIGAYGMEFKNICEYVDYIELKTGKIKRLNKEECCFGYRDSIFKHKYQDHIAVIAVGLRLHKIWQPLLTYSDLMYLNSNTVTAKQIFNVICYKRTFRIPNPKLQGNAGSFFKNPIISTETFKNLLKKWPNIPHYLQKNDRVKLSAGWLIEKCQLKGKTKGGAAVYHRQALILINKNKATSEDIIQLAYLVRQSVGKKFNIWLEPEVRLIGHDGEIKMIDTIRI